MQQQLVTSQAKRGSWWEASDWNQWSSWNEPEWKTARSWDDGEWRSGNHQPAGEAEAATVSWALPDATPEAAATTLAQQQRALKADGAHTTESLCPMMDSRSGDGGLADEPLRPYRCRLCAKLAIYQCSLCERYICDDCAANDYATGGVVLYACTHAHDA